MKKIYIAFLFLSLCGGQVYPQCTNEWVNYGNPPKKNFGQGTSSGNAVTTDVSGNIIVAGQFRDSLTLNDGTLITPGTNGFLHSFTIKYDPSGNLLWYKIGKSTNSSKPADVSDVITDNSGNIYVLGKCWPDFIDFDGTTIACGFGQCMNEIFLAKYNPSGTVQWVFRTKTSVNKDHRPGGIALKSNGNIVITGTFAGTIIFGSISLSGTGGDYNAFLAEIDPSTGNPVWAKYLFDASFYGGNLGEAASVAVDNSDNIYITGDIQSTNVILGNDTLLWGNLYIVKTDPSGNVIWGRGYKTNCGDNEAEEIRISGNKLYVAARAGLNCSSNAYFISGTDTFSIGACAAATPQSGFIIKADFSGAVENMFCVGIPGSGTSSKYAKPVAMEINAAGNVVVTGIYNVNIYFSGDTLYPGTGSIWDTYIASFDSSGNFLWAKSATNGGTNGKQTEAKDVAVFGDKVYVTGYFSDTTMFGSIPVSLKGDKDYFLWNVCDTTFVTSSEENATDFSSLTLSPNPASGEFTVSGFPFAVQTIEAINVLGEVILSKTINLAETVSNGGSSNQQTINISGFPAGIYVVRIISARENGISASRKIIIQR